MRLFSPLYARAMQWARHRYAKYWLAVVSFTEASCFIVPPDVMLMPMTLAQPAKAWSLALLTTVSSVLGGLVGYLIGVLAFNLVEPLLVSMNYMPAYHHAEQWFAQWGFWAILMAGFTPIPFKVFTIASGATGMAIVPFLLGSFLGRGARFFMVAGLMKWGGTQLESRLHRWVDVIGWGTLVLLLVGYLIYS
jgi:membrane protein YqaA with SNARE-associated domain